VILRENFTEEDIHVFNSKKISLLSIFALVVSSMSIGGLGVSAANAAIPESFTTLQINGNDVDVVDSAATINLPSGTTSASLNAVSADVQYLEGTLDGVALTTAESASGFRSYTIADTLNLKQGDQSLVLRTSDDNNHATTTGLVTITLHVDPQFSDLTVNGDSVSVGSTVNFAANTTTATIGLTLVDSNATVVFGSTPTATKAEDANVWTVSGLVAGDNTITFSVTDSAVDSLTGTYTINLNVAVSTDTGASVSINGVDRAEGEDIYVPFGTASVDVVVTLTDPNSTYFLDGDLGLETGDNDVVVTVTAADGTTTYDYHYNVVVQLNTDTSVNSIIVNGESVIDGSVLNIDPLTVEVDVQVDTTDVDATYTVEGATDLVVGENQLMITVIAADGETEQQYFIVLNVLPNTDASVSSVTVNGIDVAENDYVHVEPLTTEVEVLVVTTDENASYEITGGTDLMPGENDLSILVTAADGETSYTFFATIVVDPNNDTGVESITVNGETVEDGGTIYLPPFTEDVEVEVVTTDADATYVIDGDQGLGVGDNTLTIFVTAADGLTTQDYTVTAVVAASNISAISNISISYSTPDGVETVSAGDGDDVELPSNTLSVDVTVETEDSEATVVISGNTDLSVGENMMTITVTAPDGETSEDAYINLIVAVGDVTLSTFNVNDNAVADGDVLDLEPGTESVDVAIVTTDDLATYEVTGGYDLVLGSNDLTVTVTSVDETLTVTYHVTLNVLPYDDASISSIEINSVVWQEGEVLVTDAGDLDITVNMNNEFATYEVVGRTTNVTGVSTIVVTVTAQDGQTTQDAEIVVLAESDLVVNPSVSGAELRVGNYAIIPRTQFEKNATVSYFWFIDNDITAATTGSKHLLTVDDFGHNLRAGAIVTMKGVAPVTYVSRAVEVLPGIMKKAPTPSIKGKAAVGNTLTASTRAWPDGVETSIQWYRDGVAIDGATSETYDLVADDLGGLMTVGITGTMEGYEPLEKISKGLTVVAGTLRYSSKPGISGDFVTGGTITVDPGTWPDEAEVSLVWMRDGEEFATTTADENSYLLTADDYKHGISVDIVVTKAGYNNLTFKIKAKMIKVGTYTEAMTPEISGNAIVGETLDANAGDYPDGTTLKFVWKRNGKVISGASESSYTVTARDVNTTITVRVIAVIPGYKTVRIDSDGVDVTPAQ
jgi:hypothetical protein